MQYNKSLLLLCASIMLFSCDKDAPEIPDEEELITTLNLNLTDNTTQEEVKLTFKDLDGDGPDAPIITSDNLKANTTYSCSITLLNELENPVEDITLEIESEQEAHQFFYQTSSNLTLSTAYDDMDGNGDPIGLKAVFTTGAASSGTLTVILLHEPNKQGTGVKEGDLANAGGETDIQVTFNLTIEE